MQVCTSLQTDNHARTPPLSFLQAGCSSCCPTDSVKALKVKEDSWKKNELDKPFQVGHMQVCTSLQTNNHASTTPLSFLQAGCPSCRPTNSVKALKAVKVKRHVKSKKHVSNTVLSVITTYVVYIPRVPVRHGKHGRIWRRPSRAAVRCFCLWGTARSRALRISVQHTVTLHHFFTENDTVLEVGRQHAGLRMPPAGCTYARTHECTNGQTHASCPITGIKYTEKSPKSIKMPSPE